MQLIHQLRQFKYAVKRQRKPFVEFGVGLSRLVAVMGIIFYAAATPFAINNEDNTVIAIVAFCAIHFVSFWYIFPVLHRFVQSFNPFLVDEDKRAQQVDAAEAATND